MIQNDVKKKGDKMSIHSALLYHTIKYTTKRFGKESERVLLGGVEKPSYRKEWLKERLSFSYLFRGFGGHFHPPLSG